MPHITLKWKYNSGNEYEYACANVHDAATLYGLKTQEVDVMEMSLWSNDWCVIHWKRKENEE